MFFLFWVLQVIVSTIVVLRMVAKDNNPLR